MGRGRWMRQLSHLTSASSALTGGCRGSCKWVTQELLETRLFVQHPPACHHSPPEAQKHIGTSATQFRLQFLSAPPPSANEHLPQQQVTFLVSLDQFWSTLAQFSGEHGSRGEMSSPCEKRCVGFGTRTWNFIGGTGRMNRDPQSGCAATLKPCRSSKRLPRTRMLRLCPILSRACLPNCGEPHLSEGKENKRPMQGVWDSTVLKAPEHSFVTIVLCASVLLLLAAGQVDEGHLIDWVLGRLRQAFCHNVAALFKHRRDVCAWLAGRSHTFPRRILPNQRGSASLRRRLGLYRAVVGRGPPFVLAMSFTMET